MLLQPDKSYLLLSIIKEVKSHEDIIHWTLMKNSEVNNKHKNKDGNLRKFFSFWYFKFKRSPDGGLMKQNSRLFEHGVIQQWRIKCWETYAPVVNWIIVSSLIDIESIQELSSISIDFILDFPQSDIDVDIFIELPLGILFYRNRG